MKYEQEVRENGLLVYICRDERKILSPEKREKYRLLRLQLKRDMKLKQLGI